MLFISSLRRRIRTRKVDDSSWRAGESIDRATVRDYISQNSLASSEDHGTTTLTIISSQHYWLFLVEYSFIS
ncbi:hypothetical protein I308_100786 [Cryptococcus tetragattii IND107]|uniref:Uncharacterized protein n=1 Tax=Cryptococcus tetragattii IND107 TaxID=1296105 RepID=A0ABR3C752_9TREE